MRNSTHLYYSRVVVMREDWRAVVAVLHLYIDDCPSRELWCSAVTDFHVQAVAVNLRQYKHAFSLVSRIKVCSYIAQHVESLKALYTSPLADLFIPTSTRLLREIHSSHASITREDYSLTFSPLSIAMYSF